MDRGRSLRDPYGLTPTFGNRRVNTEIRLKDGAATLTDLGSTNGTEVNGHPVQTAALDEGDRITIGSTVLVFRWGES